MTGQALELTELQPNLQKCLLNGLDEEFRNSLQRLWNSLE